MFAYKVSIDYKDFYFNEASVAIEFAKTAKLAGSKDFDVKITIEEIKGEEGCHTYLQ